MTTVETRPDVDLTDGNFYAAPDSREAYRWMRENEPVFRDRNGLVGATTYQAVIDAERNPELFSNAGGIRPDKPGMPYMIDMDDPEHLLRRKLVNAGFTRKRVTEKEPSITALCDALIDAVCERGECDFVCDIAAPLPMAVIGDMLGVLPEDRDMLLKWSDDLVTGLSSHIDPAGMEAQAVMNAFAAYSEYTMGIIAKREVEPTDDLFSILVHRGSRRTADVGRRDRDGDPVAPHRWRRDHPAHLVRWHRAIAASPRSVGPRWSLTGRYCPRRSRRCCAGPHRSRTCAER